MVSASLCVRVHTAASEKQREPLWKWRGGRLGRLVRVGRGEVGETNCYFERANAGGSLLLLIGYSQVAAAVERAHRLYLRRVF